MSVVEQTDGATIWLEMTTREAIDAAHDFGASIDSAQSVEELADVKDKLDEAIGALLSQEQVLIKKREFLQEQRKCRT